MNMVIPDEGKLLWLQWAVRSGGGDLEDYVLELYANDYTPADNSTLASFTPASFTGYAPVTIARSSMGAPALTGHVAYSQRGTAPVFNCTGGSAETVYGWYLISDTTDTILAAQRFDTPRNMVPGAMETIDPFKLGLKTFA